ncbi:MAG: hypothetical protein ACRDOK_03370 [Streptosporangiaceae bacterium]
MRVVSRQARRRWIIVAAGTALLCGLPALMSAWPVTAAAVSTAQLRARIMSSSGVPYQGYAESNVDLGLPSLPDLGDVTSLLDGTTDQYAWYRSADQWRADVLTAAGESDSYQAGPYGAFDWSYSSDLLTQVVGSEPVRLPRAADLLPPALAQRLLSYAGPSTRLSTLPARRVAGVDAAGLRLTPAGSTSTISAVDVWADPRTGLAVEVEIFGRGSTAPVLVSRFLDVSLLRSAVATVTPSVGAGIGFATSSLPDVTRILHGYGPELPASLGGVAEVAGVPGLPDLAAYGSGFARFAVVPLPQSTGQSLLQAASSAGITVQLGGRTGVVIETPLVTVLLSEQPAGPIYLLTGTVTATVLERAAQQLPEYP